MTHVERILALLEEAPRTRAQLADDLGTPGNHIGAVIHRLWHPTATMPKRIYVLRWDVSGDYGRVYTRAVYAVGRKKDAPKPAKPTLAESSRLYRERCLRLATSASVFSQGLGHRAAIIRAKQMRAAA